MYLTLLKSFKILLVLFAIGFIGLGSQLLNLQLEIDLAAQNDLKVKSVIDFNDIDDSFGKTDDVMLHIVLQKEMTFKDHCQLNKILTSFENQTRALKYLHSPWTVRGLVSEESFLAFPPVRSDPCDDRISSSNKEIRPLFTHQWITLEPKKLSVALGFGETENFQMVIDEIDGLIGGLRSSFPEVQTSLSGPASFRYYLFKTVFADYWISVVASLLLMTLLGFYFSGLSAPFLFSILVISAFALTFGTAGLLGIPLNFLVNGLVLILLISVVSDFLFVFSRCREVPVDQAFNEYLLPSLFTSLTTVLGFLSLLVSDFAMIRNFGLIAAIGATYEWISCFFLLPAILKFAPRLRPSKKSNLWVENSLDRLVHLTIPKPIIIGLLVLAIAGLPSILFLNYHDDPVRNFPEGHPLREVMTQMNLEEKAETVVLVKVPIEVSASVKLKLRNQLKKNGSVLAVYSFQDLLTGVVNKESEERRELIERELKSTGVYKSFVSATGDEKWLILVKNYSTEGIRGIVADVRLFCGLCAVGGYASTFAEVSEMVADSLISSFILSLFFVCLVIWYLIRNERWRVILNTYLSVLLGPLILLTLLALFQVPVNIVTCIFFAVIVALAGDNFIQYFMAENKKALTVGMQQKAKASLFITLCLTMVSALFLFQTLIPLRLLGGLFVAGFIINFVGDFYLLKFLTNSPQKN